MGSSRPTDKISPIRTGSSSPDSIRRSSRTDNGNLSSPIPASRVPTVNSPDSTHTQQPYGQPGQQGPYGQQPGQWTPQPPALKQPAVVMRSLPVVTMETVPGRDISGVIGDVVGVVARTRELRPDLRGGNPVDGYVVMLTDSRQDAVARMVEMAMGAGADAIVGLRFDCSEITQSLSEVAAYGTAVTLVPVTTDAAETNSAEQAEQAEAGNDRGDQLSDDQTMRNWPPSSWPSSEPQAPSSGS